MTDPRLALGAPLECARAQRLDGSPYSGWLLPTHVELGADVGVFMYEPQQCQPTWVAWVELHPLHPECVGVWRYFERLRAEVTPSTAQHEAWGARGTADSDLATVAVGSVAPALRKRDQEHGRRRAVNPHRGYQDRHRRRATHPNRHHGPARQI